MGAKTKKLIKQYWHVAALAMATILTYGQTLNMYFWIDDWGVAYKMRYIEANIPNFGPGLFGDGAYRYNTTPFALLYPLFEFNARVYFFIGLALYFFCALSVYLLARELFKSKLSAFMSAFIFTSGYIGSFALYRLNNSYQLVLTATGLIFLSWLLFKHYRTNYYKYYFVALLTYVGVLEFLFLRSHGIFLLVLSVASSAYFLNKNSRVKTLVLKQMPFLVIWVYMFFLDPRISKTYGSVNRDNFLETAKGLIIDSKHFELFNNLLISFTNTILPDRITFSLYNILYKIVSKLPPSRHIDPAVSGYLPFVMVFILVIGTILAGFYQKVIQKRAFFLGTLITILFSGFITWSSLQASSVWTTDFRYLFTSYVGGSGVIVIATFMFLRKFEKKTIPVIFGILWILSNIITYFMYNPTSNLESTNRYLIPVFIGSTILFGGIIDALLTLPKKSITWKILAVAPFIIFCSGKIVLTNLEEKDVVANVSNIVRRDLKTIEESGIKMNEKTIFYFDSFIESKSRTTYLGGLPNLSIPLALNYHGFATIVESSQELFYLLQENKINMSDVYTFYSSDKALSNTTNDVRATLLANNDPVEIRDWKTSIDPGTGVCCGTQTLSVKKGEYTLGVNPTYEALLTHPSLTPLIVTLEISATPLAQDTPYYDLTPKYTSSSVTREVLENESPSNLAIGEQEMKAILKSESEKNEFIKKVSVFSDSEENTQEVESLVDKKFYTSWSANTISWRKTNTANLYFSFDSNQNFSKLTWLNFGKQTAPTSYTIYTSQDKTVWKEVKRVSRDGLPSERDYLVDEFPLVTSKHFKITINNTFGGRFSPPSISELWFGNTTSNTPFDDRSAALTCLICNLSSFQNLSTYSSIVSTKLSWVTDAYKNYYHENSESIWLIPDGKTHKYTVYIPAQGTSLEKIRIEGANIPLKMVINSATIKALNLQELQKEKFVKRFIGQSTGKPPSVEN